MINFIRNLHRTESKRKYDKIKTKEKKMYVR